MDNVLKLLQNNHIYDMEDMDSLLELAALMRNLIESGQYAVMNDIIIYSIKHEHYEALSWIMGILQEEFKKENCNLENFECNLGRSIPNYDEFMQLLQVDMDPINAEIRKVLDENGEAQAFFNIYTYKTSYDNIFLISSENFDTRDNDYIQYKLAVTK